MNYEDNEMVAVQASKPDLTSTLEELLFTKSPQNPPGGLKF